MIKTAECWTNYCIAVMFCLVGLAGLTVFFAVAILTKLRINGSDVKMISPPTDLILEFELVSSKLVV